jgi:hypothetical protein
MIEMKAHCIELLRKKEKDLYRCEFGCRLHKDPKMTILH